VTSSIPMPGSDIATSIFMALTSTNSSSPSSQDPHSQVSQF